MFCICASFHSITLKYGDAVVTAVCDSSGNARVIEEPGLCDAERPVKFSAYWIKDADVVIVDAATPVALKDRGAYLVLHAVIDPVKQRIVKAEAEIRDQSPI